MEPAHVQGRLPILVSPAQYTVLVRDVPDPRTLSRWARCEGSPMSAEPRGDECLCVSSLALSHEGSVCTGEPYT